MNPPVSSIAAMNSKLKGCYYSRIIMVESAHEMNIVYVIGVPSPCCHVVAVCCNESHLLEKLAGLWVIDGLVELGHQLSRFQSHAKQVTKYHYEKELRHSQYDVCSISRN